MIDGIAYKLLECIKKNSEGKYKILSKSWLMEEVGGDADDINNRLKFLSDRGYVSIRYEDENEVCLIPLSKSFEEREKDQPSKPRVFLPAFSGAVLGGIISGAAVILTLIFSGVA